MPIIWQQRISAIATSLLLRKHRRQSRLYVNQPNVLDSKRQATSLVLVVIDVLDQYQRIARQVYVKLIGKNEKKII
jgi:hypothetical protein